MNFKRYVEASDTWVDSHYIMGTSTDTITTPADIYANGTTATVGLKGNMEQSDTPSPTTPIQPSECGERTGNLLNKNDTNTANGYVANHYLDISGNEISYSNLYNLYNISTYIEVEPNTTYTFGDGNAHITPAVCEYTDAKVFITGHSFNNLDVITFTTSATTKYVRVSVFLIKPNATANSQPMLNLGSTALPYEPYGYKIPISSASTTTPVYLGEVETTRKIQKYIFTGAEDWKVRTSPDNSYSINYSVINTGGGVTYRGICSHFVNPQSGVSNIISGQCYFGTSAVSFRLDDTTDLTQWTNWLQQQYANGTPVTVWYVLASEQTATVNEPIRKIGGYADEVSGITIPTIAGANTISVDTTLQPSEVSVNYKGWHPVQSVHERENGAWD